MGLWLESLLDQLSIGFALLVFTSIADFIKKLFYNYPLTISEILLLFTVFLLLRFFLFWWSTRRKGGADFPSIVGEDNLPDVDRILESLACSFGLISFDCLMNLIPYNPSQILLSFFCYVPVFISLRLFLRWRRSLRKIDDTLADESWVGAVKKAMYYGGFGLAVVVADSNRTGLWIHSLTFGIHFVILQSVLAIMRMRRGEYEVLGNAGAVI